MKLLTLLKALNAKEHKEFERFLQSPFFRCSKSYLTFFKYLCKHHPSFDVEKADLGIAFKRCYGKQAFTDAKLYNLLSGMSHALEVFMTVRTALGQDAAHDSRLTKRLLIKALGRRNMGEYFRAEARRLIEETKGCTTKDMEDYLTLQQLHEQLYFHPDTPKYKANDQGVEQVSEHLDLFYFLMKLHFAAEMKSRERIFNVHYKVPLLNAVLESAADPALTERHPLIAVYRRLVELFYDEISGTGFKELKALFLEKFGLLPSVEQRYLLQQLVNYGILLSIKDFEVESELLELYKIAVERNMLLTDGRITDTAFFNIAGLAAQFGEFDWVKGFIEEFSHYLEESKRRPAVAMSEACLLYNQGKLDEAQTKLTTGVLSTTSFAINGKWLLLKIIFDRFILEGKDYDFLLSKLKAYEKFIRGSDLSAEKKLGFFNRISFVRKIATIKFAKVYVSQKQKQVLRQKLDALNPVLSKRWLAEKIEAL